MGQRHVGADAVAPDVEELGGLLTQDRLEDLAHREGADEVVVLLVTAQRDEVEGECHGDAPISCEIQGA